MKRESGRSVANEPVEPNPYITPTGVFVDGKEIVILEPRSGGSDGGTVIDLGRSGSLNPLASPEDQ